MRRGREREREKPRKREIDTVFYVESQKFLNFQVESKYKASFLNRETTLKLETLQRKQWNNKPSFPEGLIGPLDAYT